MTEREALMLDRITLLEESVRLLTELWTKECERHAETQMQVIKLQKQILGIN